MVQSLKMLRKSILFVIFVFLNRTTASDTMHFSENFEDIMSVQPIIRNYLTKYFINRAIYVSMLTASESTGQHQIQEDLVTALMNGTLKFTFRITTKKITVEPIYRRPLDLIFIDGFPAFK